MQQSKTNIISQLQRDLLLLQGFKSSGIDDNDAGLAMISHVFPNSSFPLAAVHEFFSTNAEDTAASRGYISGILASLMQKGAPSVWIASSKSIFPPALKSFGIEPHKIIFIQSPKPKEILWSIEEALKCDSLSAVVGEINEISFTESRRLQLAVEQSKVTAFLIRRNPKNLTTSCVTRWSIKHLPTESENGLPGLFFPRWNVELLKVRNGKPGRWQMEWRSGKFRLVNHAALLLPQQKRKAV